MLKRDPETNHLVGIEQKPHPAANAPDIGAQEAANRIRDTFVPRAMPPEYHHQLPFLVAVAGHLGADPNPRNLAAIAEALDEADIRFKEHEFPKMLYGRTLPDPARGLETHIDLRNDHVGTVVRSAEEAEALGSSWVENPADLPPRKDDEQAGFFPQEARVSGASDQPNTESGVFHQAQELDIAGGTSVSSGGGERVSSEPVRVVVDGQTETGRGNADSLEHRTGQSTEPVKPGEWDSERQAVFNRDGSLDQVRTNEERVRRQVGDPVAKDAAEKLNDPTR